MNTNSIKFIIFFLIFSSTLSGQISDNSKWDNITIYEYGVPLISCESNFENLFGNWSKWVKNHEETEFLSYEYVETINDNKLIEKYAIKLNNTKSLGRRIKNTNTEESNGSNTTYTRELYFYIHPLDSVPEQMKKLEQTKKEMYFSELNAYFKVMKEYFKNIVNLGDKVYKIKLKINQKEYNHYVICRPKENKIVYDNLFLDIRELRYRLN
jgi:hypothetical protein